MWMNITGWCGFSLVVTIPVAMFAYARWKRWLSLYKKIEGATDYEKDVVYLHQFPRWIAKQVPNMSPFALKLETWLRFQKIKYKVRYVMQ